MNSQDENAHLNQKQSTELTVRDKSTEVILYQKSKSLYMNTLQPENKIPFETSQNSTNSLSTNNLYQESNQFAEMNNETPELDKIKRIEMKNSWINFF
jgi:hypothetical protein